MPYTLASRQMGPEAGGRGTPDIIHMPGPFGHLYSGNGRVVMDDKGKPVQVRFGKTGGVTLPADITTKHAASGLYVMIPLAPSSVSRQSDQEAQTAPFQPEQTQGQPLAGFQGDEGGMLEQGGMRAEPEEQHIQAEPITVEGSAVPSGYAGAPGGLVMNDPNAVQQRLRTSIGAAMNRPGRQ